jgi:hypothetical protein
MVPPWLVVSKTSAKTTDRTGVNKGLSTAGLIGSKSTVFDALGMSPIRDHARFYNAPKGVWMPLKIQRAVLDLIVQVRGGVIESKTPDWLVRPGRIECGSRWLLVREIYRELTGQELPEIMPARNSRKVDGILKCEGFEPRIIEVDETQHFNCYRATTLHLYPPAIPLGFDQGEWIKRSEAKRRLETGGFAEPKPPLFPGEGGRHRQRAFRDTLADIVPLEYGYLPTLRIADFEVKSWIGTETASTQMENLLNRKIPKWRRL